MATLNTIRQCLIGISRRKSSSGLIRSLYQYRARHSSLSYEWRYQTHAYGPCHLNVAHAYAHLRHCHNTTEPPSCRYNFEKETEVALNQMINTELEASYMYQAMAFYFDQHDVALSGMSKYFRKASDEERQHAEKLMTYQNLRGGQVTFSDIKCPTKTRWTALSAMEEALIMEIQVTGELLALHRTAESNGDEQMCDYLEGEFLEEQQQALKQLADHVTQLRLVGPGLGTWLYSNAIKTDGMH